uniref:Calcineurin-like phosphoesterase n=1 Tax=Candidatus Kentrum sp. DK TaxID=2126562 RepID=A0A450SNR0_9GAMM|nr:MAG: Calcineurin-like phosphoesterase [Candidatus Kentron sp. DK]VFJ55414.1 MAG: Calcineurin-like phosphoesterase [Candidatus Kentron sp. DK]
MYLCTKQFLREFEDSKDPLSYVTKVEGDRVRVMQLSDLHLRLEEGERSRQLEEHIGNFSDFIKKLPPTEFHGLIVSGDLIDAQDIQKKYKEDVTGNTERHHAFSRKFIDQAAQELGIKEIEKQCLVLPGNHDILRDEKKPESSGRPERIRSFMENVHEHFDGGTTGNLSSEEPMRSPRLVLLGNENGILAIIGLDSNQAAYTIASPECDVWDHGFVGKDQRKRLEGIAFRLAEKFPSIPLYLVVTLHHHLLPVEKFEAKKDVLKNLCRRERNEPDNTERYTESVTLDNTDLLEALSAIRVSLVTQGHMHTSLTPVASYSKLDTAQKQPSIQFIACPAFAEPSSDPLEQEPYRGGLILDFDLYRGTFKVDIPINVEKFPSRQGRLRSVTRISTVESRVHRRLMVWLDKGEPEEIDGLSFTAVPENKAQKYRFQTAANAFWEEFGYALLCSIPPLESKKIEKLSKRLPSGFFERKVELPSSEPAPSIQEKRYRLLVLLRKDGVNDLILLNNQIPVRQSFYGNWDAPLFPAFSRVGLLLENIRNDLERIEHGRQDQEELRKAAREALGILGEGNKEELMRDQLIDLGTQDFLKFSPVDGQPQRYRMTLTVVPHFALNVDNQDSLAQAVNTLPEAGEDDDFRVPPLQQDSRKLAARDGYVWFPLDKWRDCPALLARNADVMEWAYGVISKYKEDHRKSAILDAIYCGKLNEIKDVWPEIPGYTPAPFSGDTKDLHDVFPGSLEKGLRRVRLNPERELKEIRPYENAKIESVIIRKIERDTGAPRIALFQTGEDGKEIKRGYLRPIQRYVLRYGIGRAARFLDQGIPADQLGSEEIGYLVLHTPGKYVALLPPILELLSGDRPECPKSDYEEFIVCDGNHRVIEYCWNQERDVYCVLIRPGPDSKDEALPPYYAYPGSSYDWKNTATSLRTSSPDLYGKYSPRQPDSEERSSDEYKKYGESWYRRFYRDFNTGFKNVGSQGGNV